MSAAGHHAAEAATAAPSAAAHVSAQRAATAPASIDRAGDTLLHLSHVGKDYAKIETRWTLASARFGGWLLIHMCVPA